MSAPRIIAILRGVREHEAAAQLDALRAAGILDAEIPLNAPGAEAALEAALGYAGTQMRIGAGTVLDTAALSRVARIGAQFVLTPNLNDAVVRAAVEQGIEVVVGVATPSEAFAALAAGAPALKIFPAASLGAGFIAALRAVLPPVPLYAVGGIDERNLAAFIAAGCAGAGLGGALYRAGQTPRQTYARAIALQTALEAVAA
ncbi:2-dehydro-3-deoxy-6-phosphogalactonate aldolase [Niveibacterium sp.]|uniref:2-dehydro-3-deoxy-6-phosphogalactonate aldolase n=1 Tax=Niveibacterium sp. TaxID=2017444 RepID=UPI0035B3300C